MGFFDTLFGKKNAPASNAGIKTAENHQQNKKTAKNSSPAPTSSSTTANNLRSQQEELMWQEKEEDEMWEEYRRGAKLQRDQEEDEMWEEYQRGQETALDSQEHKVTLPSNTGGSVISTASARKTSGSEKENQGRLGRSSSLMDENDLNNLDDIYDDATEEEDSIDNSDLSDTFSSQKNCFAIRLNDNRDWYEKRVNWRLGESEKKLYRRYPLFAARMDPEDRLPFIINNAFPDGMQHKLYIRNLSFEDNRENAPLGIRPELLPGNPLSEILGEGNSLVFIGHIRGLEFVVDRIMDAANTDCLPYEVECTAIAYADKSRIRHPDIQFLYGIREKAESLTEYTREKLTEWKSYLDWRTQIVRRQIKGCKYFKITVDENKAQLIFHLLFDSKEGFKKFRKYLYRDIQAFSNDYSKDEWHFIFDDNDAGKGWKRKYRNVVLGRFRGVRNEYTMQTGYDTDEDFDLESTSFEDAANSENVASSNENSPEETIGFDDTNIEDDDGDEAEYGAVNMLAILREYRTPYVVEAAFEVNSSDADQMKDLDDNDVIDYIYKRVLPQYDEQGFLALSAVGEFSVIDRQRRAVQQLERGESFSPNLGAWIFNVKQARIPETTSFPVQKWLNPAIAANESQRKAVEGMLCTEDVCLVQGPPGTGKTTVIAEAVYQLVAQGKRVLIASQSNDAVDNALERLADTPEIRAIRMGQAFRRKKKGEDFVEGKFSEENSLNNYYHALAGKIDAAWLNPWDEIQNRAQQYERDLRDLQLFGVDIQEYENQRRKAENQLRSLQEKLADKGRERDDAERLNNESLAEEGFFEQFRQSVKEKDTNTSFRLSARQLEIVAECLESVVKGAQKNGVLLIPHGLDAEVLGIDAANNSLALGFYQVLQLQSVLHKLSAAKQSDSGQNVEAARIRAEIDLLEKKMDTADDDLAEEYYKQWRELKKQLRKLEQTSANVSLSNAEKGLFETKFLAQLEGKGKDAASQVLNAVIAAWEKAIEKVLSEIKNYQDSKHVIDIAPFNSTLRRLEGQITLARDEIKNISLSLKEKRRQISTIGQQYGVDSGNREEIENNIRKLQKANQEQIRQNAELRGNWEDTLRQFSARLTNENLFPYDVEFYLNTYIRSCNVVGTSCTDRVLTGQDLGDFDVVIIDEVSKVTPPELLLPLMKARKAILVGDHRQLPPMFEAHEKSYSEIIDSEDLPEELRNLLTMESFNRFKKMVTASLFKDMFESADDRIKYSLLTQYRMHGDIMNIINRFYDNRLERGLNDEQEAEQKNHGLLIKGLDSGNLIVPDSHAYWLDSSALPSGRAVYDSFVYSNGNSRSTSAFNALEYYMIIELLKKLDEANKAAGGKKKTVGVISFYQRQINELRNEVKHMRKQLSSLDIDINTVDRFQGKEKQIIITSLVRNNPKGRVGQHVVAFERINVAFSRAQELLVIVGARQMYENLMVQLPNMTDKGTNTTQVYKHIINLLERKASFKTSAKLLSPSMEKEILKRCQEGGDGR